MFESYINHCYAKQGEEKPNWWDEWLNEDVCMQYKYISETDTWRPVGKPFDLYNSFT